MSDLTKTLKAKILDVENARGPAKHILNDRLADLGQVAWDYGDEIISALRDQETVRGIEGLLSKGSGEVFIDTLSVPGKTVVSWDNKDGCLAVESTLSLAVDAAVRANEKGGK